MRRFSADERRARIGVRHRLAHEERTDDPVGAARAVVAFHSTDPASVFVSAWARMVVGDVAAVEHALYAERSVVRVMGMRRTVFAAPAETAGLILAACGLGVAAQQRRVLLKLLADADPDPSVVIPADADRWLAEVEEVAVAALRRHGELEAGALGALDPRLGLVLVVGRGTKYEARQKLVSRVLTILGADGRAVRTRPKGAWSSTQFRWAALDAWAPEASPAHEVSEARGELARRWLRAFGPALPADLQWWAGWGVGDTRKALAAAGAVEVDCDGAPGVALADDLEPVGAPAPWAALLPALDPTTMGWKARDFYLADQGPELFDRTGNASPTVWWNGRIVGGWAVRADGEIVHKLLQDVGRDATDAIAAEAARTHAVLGAVRLAPRARGRSPVEAGLVA